MNEGKRPGGLTALAVINFVLFGLGILGLLGMVVAFAFINMVPTDDMPPEQKAQLEAFKDMGAGVLIFLFVSSVVSNVLLLVSGIGYLLQKKFLGWTLGNAYGVLGVLTSIVSALMFAPELGGGFNIGTIIGLVYPVVTLILLNTTFRDDFKTANSMPPSFPTEQ